MNKTKIEWCDYTWNPLTGCYHGCPYCYARRIAERFRLMDKESLEAYGIVMANKLVCNSNGKDPFPLGFAPTFHGNRLDEPIQLTKPSKIFTVSMGDLFGEWVPPHWIAAVLKTVRECPQHTFMFLTKNPQRYLGPEVGWEYREERIVFPDNAWVGLSVTDLQSWMWANCRLNYVKAKVKFLSIEPLFEDVAESIRWNGIPQGTDWVIVGAQTGPGAKPIKPEWVECIIKKAWQQRVPVFLKNNLNWPNTIQEYPR